NVFRERRWRTFHGAPNLRTFEPATTTLAGYPPPVDVAVAVFAPSSAAAVPPVSAVFHPAKQFELRVAAAPASADEPKTASSSLQPSQPRARFEYRFLPPASFPVPDPCGGRRSIAGVSSKCCRTLSRWWKKSNFDQKVPHARDRMVESYLWLFAMSYLPEYSNGRMFAGKLATIIVLLDDTYDAYGTVEELQLFTEAFQRWDIRLTESLPQSMKVIFEAILELCEEIEELTTESGNSNFVVPHFKQAICNLVKGYLVEAKWCDEGYIPTYDEYKINGMLTSCCPIFATTFVGLADFATKDVLDWILSNPDILRAASVIARVLDDMASHRFEQERVHVASAVECCMKQYSISEGEAYNLIHKDVEDCWKVINEECLKSNDIPKIALDCIANYARMAELSYEDHKDKFTNGELLIDYVSSLLVYPFCLDQTVI
ncbi:probable sesquiterpene synthase, partial [Vigna angularis]